MPTGQPISCKCPKCMRGKWGKPPVVKGLQLHDEWRERFIQRTRRRGKSMSYERKVTCLDCGHTWWSNVAPGARKLDSPGKICESKSQP